jgi:hypothetical protein
MQPFVKKLNLKSVRHSFIIALFVIIATFETRACFILFARDGNRILVANHEDWTASDGAIRIVPPAAGSYGSVIFTFSSEGWAQGGMNEKGLFFDAARTPYQEIFFDGKSNPPGFIWQTILDQAATVEEAIAILQQYNLPELSEVTVMLADASGNAVLVGAYNHRLAVRPVAGTTLLQTNFNQWHPGLSDEPACWRYDAATRHLAQFKEVSVENMLSILKKTHQDSLTVYSNIYDLTNKRVYTYNKRNFNHALTVQLPEIFQNGDCLVSLDSLEKDNDYWKICLSKNKRIKTIKGKITDEHGAPLSFVNIGIPGQNIGTLSDPDGSFEISVPGMLLTDTLRFSSIGYREHKACVNKLSDSTTVCLQSTATMLSEVTISSKRLHHKTQRLGWMGGKDGVLPLDTLQGGGAVALLVEAPASPLFVDKLQVRLMYNSKDTARLRLHFFEYDSLHDRPGEELLSKEIFLEEGKRFGWLRFDLSDKNILLPKKKFFVGFEWIEDMQTRKRMISGLRKWEAWKRAEFEAGNKKVERIVESGNDAYPTYKYHSNMMEWPGFKDLPPFTGLMIESGKTDDTIRLRTFERKTSFGEWKEMNATLNVVITVIY